MSDAVSKDVSKDWFIAAIEDVAAAARASCDAQEDIIRVLEEARRSRLEEQPLESLVRDLIGGGARDVRLDSAEAFRRFERSFAVLRSAVVRSLVDENGMSLTEVAAILNVSRQAVAQLYNRQAPEQ